MSGNHNVMKDFQNRAALRSISVLKFANIIKILTNTIKVIYIETNNENAIQQYC